MPAPGAPDPGQELAEGPVGDGGYGGEGPVGEGGVERAPDVGPEGQGERADREGGAPDVGSEGQGERADGEGGAPEGGGPEGEGEGPGGKPGGGGERADELEGSDPAALTPPSLRGEGYEVSLSLESSFQMADTGTPLDGAAPGASPAGLPVGGAANGAGGVAVGGSRAQLNASTTAVAEGGGAPISRGSEGTAASGVVSPEADVSAASSESEGEGANATAGAVSEAAASAEAEGEVAVSDASGAEESSSAEASGSESADAGDGGDEGAADETAQGEDGGDEGAADEKEKGESAEREAADDEAAGEEGAVGGDDGEGPSEKPKAPSAAVAVKRVDARRASQNLASGDAQATSRTLQGLNLPDLSGRRTPTPAAIANSLQQVRQRVVSGAGPR